ncbi:MAG: hypothetical protein IJT21_04195 [Synergistaceae bacterium]|nr:hypothetical protein [Synergistaceae bacterium]
MRKIFAVILALIALSSSAFANDLNQSLFPEYERNINREKIKFDDGLKIEFLGAYVYNDDGNIHVIFLVTSEVNTTLNTSAGLLFDDRGGRFFIESTRIAGYRVDKLDLIANVPVVLLFEYPSVYERKLRNKDLRSIASVKFTINNHELEYERIQLQNWAACLKKIKPYGYSMREWFSR